MAKGDRKLYDFSGSTQAGSWADTLRKNYLTKKNAESEIDAVIYNIVNENPDAVVSEEQRTKAVNDLLAGRPYNLQPSPMAAPVLPKPAVATSEDGDTSTLGLVPKAAVTGLADIGADLMYRNIKAAEEGRDPLEGFSPLPGPGESIQKIMSPVTKRLNDWVAQRPEYKEVFTSLSDYVQRSRAELDAATERNIAARPVRGRIERAITDVAGSAPSTLASIPGGPFAGIPMAVSKADAFRAATEAGATYEEAEDYADIQANIEGGISAIPTARLFKVVGKSWFKPAEKALAKKLTGTGVRTVSTMLGEGIEEGATTAAQDLANRMQGGEDTAIGRYAAGQVSQDLLSDVLRAGGAGIVGGSIVAPHHAIQRATEAGKQAADTIAEAGKHSESVMRPVKAKDDETTRELYFAEQDLEKAAQQRTERAEAFAKAEAERAGQDTTKADEMEAGFQTMENLRKFGTPERVEEYAGVLERTPINPPASVEVTPEQVAEAREVAPVAKPKSVKAPKKAPAKKVATPKPLAPKATIPDNKITDSEINDLTAQLNLGMRGDSKQSPSKGGNFQKKSIDIVKNLVKKNTRETADVQNLLRQGKLVLVPNAEAAGRTDEGNVAEYDTGEGRMYLYTDKVNPSDVTGIMARALHESTHSGQFNDRQGRSSVLKQMMSPEKENKASATILKAAGNGNKIAMSALKQAKAASPDEAIQNLELVPYFVTEAAKARGTTLGQLRGTANDIVSSAKNFMREKLGVDLDISMRDLDSAAQKTAGELVKTEVKPSKERVNLGMVLGPSAKSFAKAKAEGKTYREVADTGERFEVSDKNAELPSDRILENYVPFDNEGTKAKMDEVLSHDDLYNEYPWLASYNVEFKPLEANAYGMHDTKAATIVINDNLLRSALYSTDENVRQTSKDRIRNTLLHEAQHAIQAREGFVAGANSENFMPQNIVDDEANTSKKLVQVVKNFDIKRAINSLNEEAKRAWDNEVKAQDIVTDNAKAALFLDEGYAEDSSDRLTQRYHTSVFLPALTARNEAVLAYRQAENKAFMTYLRDQGEMEARGTERRSRMSKEEIEAAPRQKMGPEELEVRGKKVSLSREQALDTFGLAMRREPASFSRTLGMQEGEAPGKKRIPPVIKSLFDSAQGVGKQINELMEYAASSPAGDRMEAEASQIKYSRALANEAYSRGMTPDQLNAEIAKKLDEIDKSTDGFEANRAAFVDVASQYGEAGEHLINLRDQIDALTMDIIRQRAANGNPLSEAEKKRYKTLLNNLGRYSHRQYAANAGKIGDKYAQRVWKDFEAVEKGTGRRASNPRAIENHQKVAKAVSYLVDNNLRIPPNEELEKLGAEQTRNLYNVWGSVGNPDAMSLDAMKGELVDARDRIGQERMEKAAEGITKELLGLAQPTSAVTNYYRGGKQDTGILQERKNIPKELRELMGEITDPSTRLMLTAGKQAEFVARNKMLLDLTKMIGPHVQTPDSAGTDAVDGMEKLEGEAWGPMEGYYVSPELRNVVGDVVQQLATFEQAVAMAAHKPSALTNKAVQKAIDVWGKVAATSKVAQIIGNPMNFIFNFVGAPRQMLMNGNVNPKNLVKSWATSAELIANAMNPAVATDEAKRMNKFGITDSAFVGEIKQTEYRVLRDLVKEMSGKNPSAAMAFLKQKGVGMKELYAMMDVWSKIANFYNQTDVLSDFYEKNGTPRTQDEIDREAADIVNRTNITYKRAAPLVKAMERGGLTQFGTYFYEVFRSEIANVMQGVDELKRAKTAATPEAATAMRVQGTKRLAGQAAAWALTAAVSKAASQAVFGDDEEKERQMRALLPEFAKNQDFMKIGKDKDGKDVLFNISRLDPVGPITDIMRAAMHEDASPEAIGKSIFDLYVAPRVGSQLFKALQVSFDPNAKAFREPVSQQVVPGLYSDALRISPMEDRKDRAWTNVVESFAPGIVSSWRDTNARPEAKDVPSAVNNALTYAGASMYKLNPAEAAKYASRDQADTLKNVRRDLAQIFTDHPEGLSEAELTSRVIEAQEKEREAFNELRDVYLGMQATGMSPREASVVFKGNKISGDVVRDIKRGEFNSHAISRESLREYMKKEQEGKTRAEKRDIKKKWNEIYKLLRVTEESIGEEE